MQDWGGGAASSDSGPKNEVFMRPSPSREKRRRELDDLGLRKDVNLKFTYGGN